MAQIDALFRYLIASKGSDLHLSEGQPPKIRVHGAVVAIPEQEILQGDGFRGLLEEICEPTAFARYLEIGDLDFAYEMDEDSRFRCNYLKQQNGLAAVFRLIPTEIASLESLGVPAVVKEFGHMRSGLVLVTGPTGSGKSTTLAALLDYININFNRHIITVEEPIEFIHSNKKSIITQREVPIQTPSFADGLRASLREDSDIVLCKRVDRPGRTAVHEIMFATPAVCAIIREGATQKLYDVITGGKSEGMQFMDESIWSKLREGMISPEEAYMKAIDKTRFKKFLPASLAHLGDASGESPLEH